MASGISIFLIAAGAILYFAVNKTVSGLNGTVALSGHETRSAVATRRMGDLPRGD